MTTTTMMTWSAKRLTLRNEDEYMLCVVNIAMKT